MERGECFNIYSALTDIYKPHPTRFRDWVSNPKANGYQALHNTFMSKDGQWIEVQIRSDRMDDIAEQGFAAHWKYKDKNAAYDENELNKWLDSIKEILDDPQPDTLDLLDTIKLNLFTNEIMVFTPKGELRKMPAGATVVDFAFSVHTFLGSHCLGAKVNHKLVPLSYKLKSGDQVEILTSNKQHVKDEWLNFATTAKARGKIQAAVRRERRELQKMGEEVVRQFLTQAAFEPTTAIYERLALFHHFRSRDALFLAIGERKLKLGEDDLDLLKGKKKKEKKGWRRYIPFMGKDDKNADAPAAALMPTDAETFFNSINRKQVLVLNDDNLPLCRFADCCRPIPGDDVIGYLSPEHVFVIHKRKCADAVKLKTRYGNDIVACCWDTHKQLLFDVTIFLRGMDSQGVLYAIADVLHKLTQFQVKSITLSTTDGIFEGKLFMSVFDTADVQQVCNALMSIENITEAVRVE